MIEVKLSYNNAYKWYNNKNIYVIGYLFYEDKMYKNEKLLEFIKFFSVETIKSIVKKSTGFFSIIIIKEKKIILISDIVRTFPVFYKFNKNNIIVMDNINNSKELNSLSTKELLILRYVTGDETLFKGIKQLENAEIVTIYNNKNIKKEKYFYFKSKGIKQFLEKDQLKKLDKLLITIFKRLIVYLDGRTAVIPLSGGHDSRMIAYYLKYLNYPHIITYTYGNEKGNEIDSSKSVANFLNLKWIYVPYRKKSMSRKYSSKKAFGEMADYCGRGFSIPHIQEWEAIDYLLKNKIIDKNSVIIPGHTMDFIAGNHIKKELLEKKVSLETVKNVIYSDNYNLYKGNINIFNNKLKKIIGVKDFVGYVTKEEACNYLENWDFEERQTKFIVNSIRTYDYHFLEWYLPFWDRELVNFFKKLPIDLKYERKFFVSFEKYKYKDLMLNAPLSKNKNSKKYKGISRIISNMYRPFHLYFNHALNFYNYFTFRNYIYKIIKYKTISYDYFIAIDYINHLNKNTRRSKK